MEESGVSRNGAGVEEGKIRFVGLSNWYVEKIDDFIDQLNIKPALVQNEIHQSIDFKFGM